MGTRTSSGGYRRGGGCHRLRAPPWGVMGGRSILGTPALRSDTGRGVPSASLKTSRASQRAVRNQDSALSGPVTDLLTHSCSAGGSGLQTAWGSGCPARTAPVHAPALAWVPAPAPLTPALLLGGGCCCQQECVHLEGMELAPSLAWCLTRAEAAVASPHCGTRTQQGVGLAPSWRLPLSE